MCVGRSGPAITHTIKATLKACGAPLAHALVYAAGEDYAGRVGGRTDAHGKVSLPALPHSTVTLEVALASRPPSVMLVEERAWGSMAAPSPLPVVSVAKVQTGRAGSSTELEAEVCEIAGEMMAAP